MDAAGGRIDDGERGTSVLADNWCDVEARLPSSPCGDPCRRYWARTPAEAGGARRRMLLLHAGISPVLLFGPDADVS